MIKSILSLFYYFFKYFYFFSIYLFIYCTTEDGICDNIEQHIPLAPQYIKQNRDGQLIRFIPVFIYMVPIHNKCCS